MSNPQAPGERSPAEPTMEEILASIRRIIADGKPGEREPEAPETDVAPPPPEPKSVASSPSPDRSNAETERPAATPDAADPALMLTRMVAEGGSVLTVAPGELGQGEVIAVEEALLLTEPLPAEASRPAAAATVAPTAPAPTATTRTAAAPASPQAPRWIEPPMRAAPPPATPSPGAPFPGAAPRVATPPAAPSQPVSPQPIPQAAPPAPREAPPSPPTRAGRTIEEVALEALEPILRAWLDRHLREIVERRVQEEIDRISRKWES